MSFSAAILDRRRFGAGKNSGGARYSSALFPLFLMRKWQNIRGGTPAGNWLGASSDAIHIVATIS